MISSAYLLSYIKSFESQKNEVEVVLLCEALHNAVSPQSSDELLNVGFYSMMRLALFPGISANTVDSLIFASVKILIISVTKGLHENISIALLAFFTELANSLDNIDQSWISLSFNSRDTEASIKFVDMPHLGTAILFYCGIYNRMYNHYQTQVLNRGSFNVNNKLNSLVYNLILNWNYIFILVLAIYKWSCKKYVVLPC